MLGRCEGWASRCWSCGHTWGRSPMPGQWRGTALSRWGGLCSAPALQLLAVISVSCCPPAAQCFTFSCGQLGAVAEPEQCVHPAPAASVCFGRVTPLVPACCWEGGAFPLQGAWSPPIAAGADGAEGGQHCSVGCRRDPVPRARGRRGGPQGRGGRPRRVPRVSGPGNGSGLLPSSEAQPPASSWGPRGPAVSLGTPGAAHVSLQPYGGFCCTVCSAGLPQTDPKQPALPAARGDPALHRAPSALPCAMGFSPTVPPALGTHSWCHTVLRRLL